jgi:hypothetical protein
MLFRPEAYEPLTDTAWDEARARAAIAGIVADTDSAYAPQGLWPADEWDAWMAALPLKNLYVGAAGVVWALEELHRRELAATALDLSDAALRALAAWEGEPDFMRGVELPGERQSALLTGETGILLTAWRVAPAAELADRLLTRVRENLPNDADDVMWGVPGTLVAARAMLDWTGEECWADAWRESADVLWRTRDEAGWWTQHLHGESYRGLGPFHGLVGNVLALLRGGDLLAAERRGTLTRATGELLARTAVREDRLANWPLADGAGLADEEGEIRLQWCAGAPGIVGCAAAYVDEELLLAGAELAWRAGPPGLDKGPGLCHGTAGTGHAFLATFERTGDERWLVRARRFAMHALEQVERLRERRGRGRYSLFTGDVGVALYAADCVAARAAYPVFSA